MKKYKNMSPLILVGILVSTALADVSHVLSGAAQPPANPNEVNLLASASTRNPFQTGNPQDFWWMGSNSPLKEAYEYFKKCSSKGNCLPPVNAAAGASQVGQVSEGREPELGPIDLKNNPFINGAFQSGSGSSSAAFASSSSYASSSSSASSGCTACAGGTKSGGVAAFHAGTKIDVSKNPFLNGQFAIAGNGEKVKNENGFLGVQPKKPGFATTHPLSNKKPFATSPPIGQQSFVLGGGKLAGIECKGQGSICVAKDQCVNGVTNKEDGLLQAGSAVQYCNADTEVCCRLAGRASFDTVSSGLSGKVILPSSINGLADISAGKSSVTGSPLKFSGGAGTSPGQIQVLVDQSAGFKPQIYNSGENGAQASASTSKPVRDISLSASSVFPATADYSNIRFDSNVRFASTIQGPAYLPPIEGQPSSTPETVVPSQPPIVTYQPSIPTTPRPIPTTPRLCPAGTFLAPSGICETPIIPGVPSTPGPCPPGTTLTAFGSCEAPQPPPPACPIGTILRDGTCVSPTPKPCPLGTFLTPSGLCEAPKTPAPCPFGTILKPDGSCERPSIPTTPRPCPPGTILTLTGLCEAPRTPAPCPFGTIQKPDGSCESPSIPTTPRSCPPGTILTISGLCEAPPTPAPPCPYGAIQHPDGTCEVPTIISTSPIPCPLGTILAPSGSCEAVRIPTPSCPLGTIPRPDGSCERPTPPPIRTCPPGTILKSSGLCEAPAPRCPFGTIQKPDGSCERPGPPPTPRPCPPGTFLTGSGICESPVTPTPRPTCPPGTFQGSSGVCEYPVPSTTIVYECPPGTFKTSTGLCERPIVTTPRPPCPFGTYLTPSGSCETPPRPSTPKPPPRPFVPTTTSREYLPPVTPTQPTPPPSNGYIYNTPTPKYEYPTSTLVSNPNNINNAYVPAPTTPQYLPPPPDTSKEGSFISGNVRLPDTTTTTRIPISRPPPPPVDNGPPVGCAAALKCVQEIYCTVEGFVSPVPVVLTKEQELLRAPTTECRDIETGIIGKCCRDLNYKDPWPSANLVNGVDDGQYREDNLYGQRELLGTNRLTRSFNGTNEGIVRIRDSGSSQNVESGQPACGERHYDTKPLGPGPIDANFAEYPWQAMILRDSNRSLLCGGAIIRRNAVLTTARCVEGLETSDVLIKGGEWKLGIDEEPLPFQIIKVAAIIRHPNHKTGSYENDLAVLVLQEKLRLSKNVGTICLPQPNQAPASKCVATGWGKRILQLHAKGAIMHHIGVSIVDGETCQQNLAQNFQDSLPNYTPNTLCAVSNIDQCKVDYGSALACSEDGQHYTLHGIYSWDTGCKQEGQIGGYVAPDVEWIESTLGKTLKELKRTEKEYLLKYKG